MFDEDDITVGELVVIIIITIIITFTIIIIIINIIIVIIIIIGCRSSAGLFGSSEYCFRGITDSIQPNE